MPGWRAGGYARFTADWIRRIGHVDVELERRRGIGRRSWSIAEVMITLLGMRRWLPSSVMQVSVSREVSRMTLREGTHFDLVANREGVACAE